MSDAVCPECGANPPVGSDFCPACGQALGEQERPRPSGPVAGGWIPFLDKTWDFFASTKVAAVLITVIATAAILGSLIEQETLYQDWRPPAMYYPVRYGPFWGPLYMNLGLTHAYSSIWFAALILLLVVNLVIGSLNRLIPLMRMLAHPQVWKLPHFLHRQEVIVEAEGGLSEARTALKRAGYRVREDRECLYADKGRPSRYGPYVIHVGLLLVCFAAFSKALPGWDLSKDVWIPDGQTVKVPGEDFAITNHKFTMETYPNGAPSRFATDASILDGGKEVFRGVIEVNHPITHGGWEIYQSSFREEPGFAYIKIMSAASKQPAATIAFDLRQPEAEYPIGDRLKMVVRSYYHDFTIDPATEQGTNASYEVKNPVLLAEFLTTDREALVGRTALIIMAPDAEPVFEGPIYLEVDRVEKRWYTALKLHRDHTVPFMYAGLAVVMLGMMMTFFLFHWQVWIREENGALLIGAKAHKNRYGLKQELQRLFGKSEGEATHA